MPVRVYHYSGDKVTQTFSHDYFSADYPKKLQDNGRCTIDIPVLNLYETHHLFVYGSLKKGFARNRILTSSNKNQFCGVGITADKFDMLLANPMAFPIAINLTTKERLHKIKGELWLVDVDTIIKVDQVEINGKLFEREIRKIWVGKQLIPAWMYVGKDSFWKDKDVLDCPRFIHPGKVNNLTDKDYYYTYNEDLAKKLIGARG